VIYLPIKTIKTAGAMIPIKGIKIDGKKDVANSPDIKPSYHSITTLENTDYSVTDSVH